MLKASTPDSSRPRTEQHLPDCLDICLEKHLSQKPTFKKLQTPTLQKNLCSRWMTIVISNSRRTAGLPVPVWFYLDLPKGEPLLYHVLSPFPPSSNRKRKWWRYFHPRVLKPGDAASGPPETEIDCFSHATSPEIDQMAPPLHRKWKHSTGKWTSGPRLSDTKKDLVSLSVCSTDCRVMFEESGVEIPSNTLLPHGERGQGLSTNIL